MPSSRAVAATLALFALSACADTVARTPDDGEDAAADSDHDALAGDSSAAVDSGTDGTMGADTAGSPDTGVVSMTDTGTNPDTGSVSMTDTGTAAKDTGTVAMDTGAPDTGSTAGLHVVGNKFMDGGKTVRLLGVDHSGSEYRCIQNNGFFEGPVNQASINAMKTWHVNTVRVPLNEDCWLNINGAPAMYSGSSEQSAINTYVRLLRSNGLYVILDLHWNGGGGNEAYSQHNMADADHAPAFWSSVATMFKDDTGVIFNLYNEPHDLSWSCWKSGGCSPEGWNVAGMDQMITAVRGTGATNIVMAGGVSYASDLSAWLANKPNDPLNQLAASYHTYNFTGCSTQTCWDAQIAPVAAQVPLVTGELGENDCAHGYVDQYMAWADGKGISYLGWAWDTNFDCGGGPGLITNYDGTPTNFGAGIKAHLILENP